MKDVHSYRLLPPPRLIRFTRSETVESTYILSPHSAMADGPSSLSGGMGLKAPILVPFKSKIRTVSAAAADAYRRSLFGSITTCSNGQILCCHSCTIHFQRNFPFESKTWMRLWSGS